jgi:hypothetical protein
MWFRAGLPRAQFTFFARLGSAGGATHGEDLFRTEFFLHGEESIREYLHRTVNSEQTGTLAQFGTLVRAVPNAI